MWNCKVKEQIFANGKLKTWSCSGHWNPILLEQPSLKIKTVPLEIALKIVQFCHIAVSATWDVLKFCFGYIWEVKLTNCEITM